MPNGRGSAEIAHAPCMRAQIGRSVCAAVSRVALKLQTVAGLTERRAPKISRPRECSSTGNRCRPSNPKPQTDRRAHSQKGLTFVNVAINDPDQIMIDCPVGRHGVASSDRSYQLS